MEVKTCSSFVSMSSPSGTFGSNVATSNQGSFAQAFAGSSYFSTSDSSNCGMSFSLRTVSPDAVYSGSDVAIDSSGTVTFNPNKVINQNLKIRVTAGQSGGFSQDTSTFTIQTQCSSDQSISEASSPANPQFVTHGSSSEGFVLPSYQTG
jgi:hypothetical protein